jgi:putative exporter of polyketide antibiotics
MNATTPPRQALERIEDAIRESGTLIVALTPLDATFAPNQEDRWLWALILFGSGILLFGVALFLERRRTRDR